MISSKAEFDVIDERKGVLPLLGLFANDHMDYDIDRQPSKEPSLREMVTKALRILSKDTENQKQGFFLMIEGSRIDMAAHSNDPSAHVRDIVAYQDAVAVVKTFVDENPGTVMISVSDHETGGFTLGRQTNISDYPEYLWYPEVIARPRNSTFALQQAVLAYNASDKETFVREEIVKKGLGIDNATNEEIADILAGGRKGDIFRLDAYLANMTSFRAQLGWSTHGHTGVDVNLYAYGQDYEKLRGNHENTDIGDFIVDFLGLNLRSVTKILNKNITFTTVGADKVINSTDGLQHFHSHP
jgi:alkaline phosphatase